MSGKKTLSPAMEQTMNESLLDRPDTIIPDEGDTRLAEESSRQLSSRKPRNI